MQLPLRGSRTFPSFLVVNNPDPILAHLLLILDWVLAGRFFTTSATWEAPKPPIWCQKHRKTLPGHWGSFQGSNSMSWRTDNQSYLPGRARLDLPTGA